MPEQKAAALVLCGTEGLLRGAGCRVRAPRTTAPRTRKGEGARGTLLLRPAGAGALAVGGRAGVSR
ncbi:hypothetical protein EAO68_22460 [Streptomyces sp. wa22]|nr:hypothetical protein EAO68_22460 [Streptomyces sp. wa22]